MGAYFQSNAAPSTDGLFWALQDIPDVDVTKLPGVQQFDVTVALSDYSQSISLDLDGLDLDLDSLGLGLSGSVPIGLSVTQSGAIDLTAGVDLEFSFGLDGEGQFYVLNPELDAHFSFGEDKWEILDAVSYTHLTLPTNREV